MRNLFSHNDLFQSLFFGDDDVSPHRNVVNELIPVLVLNPTGSVSFVNDLRSRECNGLEPQMIMDPTNDIYALG